MIINAYAIYDRKALRYHTPFYAHQDGEAARSFADLVNDINTTVGRHPDDYVLYRVGAYDDANGSLLPASVLDHVVDGSALVRNLGADPRQGQFPDAVMDRVEAIAKHTLTAVGKSSS